jgi:hypothetical protein
MLLVRPSFRPFGKDRPVQHEYADDLESHFHLLMYEVLHHLDIEIETRTELKELIFEYFDVGVVDRTENRLYEGQRKSFFFTDPRPPITISDNKPLTQLIKDMRKYFKIRYSVEIESGMKSQFDNPRRFLEIINMALEGEGWPDNDKLACFSVRVQGRNKRFVDSTWEGNDSEGSRKRSRSSRYYS